MPVLSMFGNVGFLTTFFLVALLFFDDFFLPNGLPDLPPGLPPGRPPGLPCPPGPECRFFDGPRFLKNGIKAPSEDLGSLFLLLPIQVCRRSHVALARLLLDRGDALRDV